MAHDSEPTPNFDRYARQVRFAALGDDGQRRLGGAKALLCGCGALGSAIAHLLVRAGIGALRIVDRDFVEASNLPRQSLFDEDDARVGAPKAVAAAEHLRRINSDVRLDPIVADIEPSNIERFCDGVGLILDGTDNFETRFLINDAAIARGLPWIYGGCVGAEGRTMTIVPGETACLRCLMPECPAPGVAETCETAGILGPIVGAIASIEACEAIKILSGRVDAISRDLTVVDLWRNQTRRIDVRSLRDQVDCPACRHEELVWLAGRQGHRTAVLCGRNAVQLSHPGASVSLERLAEKLSGVGPVVCNPHLLRLKVEGFEITVFADARAIVAGTSDVAAARAVYAKYIGH
ncbi:MAG: ThiF family adenylyltransferase [Planctomycetaceae bacterium]|nr:ThiF family adenylyltransferase [Planctomycetaceae bacterium]